MQRSARGSNGLSEPVSLSVEDMQGETVYETKTYNGGGHQDSSSMLVHFTKVTPQT